MTIIPELLINTPETTIKANLCRGVRIRLGYPQDTILTQMRKAKLTPVDGMQLSDLISRELPLGTSTWLAQLNALNEPELIGTVYFTEALDFDEPELKLVIQHYWERLMGMPVELADIVIID